jgi:N utilization substance protein A
MSAMAGATATPIEQVGELGDSIIQKLIAAGVTTVEALADMTPEQLEEIPGIGEKTLEKISVAVRHYFGQYEEGEERPASMQAAAEGDLAAAKHAEDASTEEEVEALEQDLTQAGEEPASPNGSGLINDEMAEERLAEVTEVGPALDEEGAESVVPGREDVSERLAEHEPNPEVARDEAVVEGNVEEVKEEERGEKKVDEGTGG